MVLGISQHSYDSTPPLPVAVHCYPVTFRGDEPKHARGDLCKSSLRHSKSNITNFQHAASHPDGVHVSTIDACCSLCNNDDSCTAWIVDENVTMMDKTNNCWIGFCVDGVGEPTLDCNTSPTSYQLSAHVVPPTPSSSDWWILGDKVDWYLSPSDTKYQQYGAYYELTGAPALPPRYGLGFMATYWGYDTMEEVIGNMTKFRDELYPIDSFIMDYDWWSSGNKPTSKSHVTSQDFEYDSIMFGPHEFHAGGGIDSGSGSGTFPSSGAASAATGASGWPAKSTQNATDLFHYIHDGIGSDDNPYTLRMRFSGIRKPRTYSHVNKSKAEGWLLPDADTVGAGLNNWNFTVDSFLTWYAAGNQHFVKDGIDFWWNDEGETQWDTYYQWNQAQRNELNSAVNSNQRMFTLNRAFTPGMQRFPAVTWTGDMQDCSHKKALLFAQWGQPWFTCDLTAPSATVLLRQYQGAVWWPIMRVHAMRHTPRFPWYWGGDEHQIAFRQALNTRYAILPYLYSLSHQQHQSPYAPMVHPASWDFPTASLHTSHSLNSTYMVGHSIICADLTTSNNVDPNENSSTVVLPRDVNWFLFNTTEMVVGTGVPLKRNKNLSLLEFPVYVKMGSIVPIHPWDRPSQHSQSQRGLLEIQVYGGDDAMFTLYEDDGMTTDYATKGDVRSTVLQWSEKKKTLAWSVEGGKSQYGPEANDYTELRVAWYAPNASTGGVVRSKAVTIGRGGTLAM